ncbi:sigma-54-dependent Fis family transcriptional regulator [Oceanisphaera sediminis]|uniref:Sigma-54-dependent Fis family transcriptional regulator n=2 Tax=Oceanisphaera sediminis TaxID=981381 RepID=A0ABP7EQ70_9GAMM
MALHQPQDPYLLERSWQRSRDYGLSRHSRVDRLCLLRPDLQQRKQQHAQLLRYLNSSLPLFEQLQQGRRCRLLFADAEGTILFSTGDPYFGSKAQKMALANGASWHEQSMGTNAIGTALSEQKEICILGQQHFLAANHGIGCSASPVLSPSGELLGVIDISSEMGEHNQDMLLTARLMAQAVENALVINQQDTHWILNLAPDAGSLQQPWSGIIALREDGKLLGANRSARNWLQELDIPTMLSELKQGELTPLGQGMALLSRQSRSSSVASPKPAPQARSPVPHEVTALKLMARRIPLLVQGETGTGKDHLVRRLHQASQRADGPLVAVNCGALPTDLLEAELFGYVGGAFTGGSKQGRPGYVRAAHQGILFLDEIGELPLAAQTRLLRVLQEKTVTPLGSHVPEPVDFQLIAASHRNLATMVEQGEFRQDLYFRIKGFKLTLPPLREYKDEDFDRLVRTLLSELQQDDPVSGATVAGEKVLDEPVLDEQVLDETALQTLKAYSWPGNIRQLKQLLEVALVLADGNRIDLEHLPELPRCDGPATGNTRDLKSLGDQLIERTLKECNGNVSAAARQLNLSRTTIYARLKALKNC